MTPKPEEDDAVDAGDRLVDLAGAVSDRTSVDWESAEALGSGVAGLRTLARLAAAFDADNDAADTDADADAQDEKEMPNRPLFRWGHLDVLEPLGEGRFGQVYRAHDRRLGRDVALKLARDEAELPRRALEEARRLARVRHPNVLTVHGVAVHDGRAGLWTDLLSGQTLEDRLERDGPFGEGELRLVTTELCRALAAVQGAGLVHGDVKTSNVVRDRDGRLVLVDFGAARLASASAPAIVQATPSYLAPEVARGEASPTAGSDLYALGALLYRLATGEFWRGTRPDLGSPPLRDARPDLEPALVRGVESLLAERPDRRPASAGEAERLLLGEDDATPDEVGSGSWRSWAALAAVLLVAASLALLATLWIDGNSESPRSSPATGDAAAAPEPAVLWADRGGESFVVTEGATLRPGDRLSLRVELAAASHVYVFNEDDAGELFVLFPLPGEGPRNPLPRGEHRLPSLEQSWQVTSAGGRERFLIVGSARPRPDLERFGEEHDLARSERAVTVPVALSTETPRTEILRGVGGLTDSREGAGTSRLARLHASLEPGSSAEGSLWARFLEVDNPPPIRELP